MQQPVTFRLPDSLAALPEKERTRLIRAALLEAKRARIRQLKAELAESRKQVRTFVAKYGMSLEQFEEAVLSRSDSFEAHQDYNDWFYWAGVMAEKQDLLATLQGERRQ